MILKLLPISLIQCALLTGGQVLMKYGLTEVGDFSFTWQYFHRLFTNQHGLSDGQPELCDGHVCRHHFLSRTNSPAAMDRCIPDTDGLRAHCTIN